MTVDAVATESHFVTHLAAIWDALPPRMRGRFVVPPKLEAHARQLGLKPAAELPKTQRPVIVASYGDLKRVRAADRRQIVMAQHGAGQSYGSDHPSYAGGRDHNDVGLFLVPNLHAAGRDRRAYPDAEVAVVGCPRLDLIPERAATEDTRPTLAISFHFQCGIALETRPAWRDFRPALPLLARKYRILGHGHPRMIETLRPHYERLGIEVVENFDEVCRRADLYICDNSSTLFEFAHTGRPVVVMNAKFYRRSARFGIRFWDAANVGLQVDRHHEMLGVVGEALKDGRAVQKAREASLDIVYAHRTGAAQRAADAITGWAA